jgi:hypothetical protein
MLSKPRLDLDCIVEQMQRDNVKTIWAKAIKLPDKVTSNRELRDGGSVWSSGSSKGPSVRREVRSTYFTF